MYAEVLDVSTPFAVVALPTSEPVDDQAVEAAHAALLALYPDASPIRTRVLNALPRVEERHTWIINHNDVQIGDQRVKLSKDGQQHVCSCPDWKLKYKTLNGICKHVCACEHVRLAQAMMNRVAPAPTASLTIRNTVLAYALSACYATGTHEVRVQYDDTFGWLQLQAANVDISIETTGTGSTDVVLPMDTIVATIDNLASTSDDLLLQVIDNQLVFAPAAHLAYP